MGASSQTGRSPRKGSKLCRKAEEVFALAQKGQNKIRVQTRLRAKRRVVGDACIPDSPKRSTQGTRPKGADPAAESGKPHWHATRQQTHKRRGREPAAAAGLVRPAVLRQQTHKPRGREPAGAALAVAPPTIKKALTGNDFLRLRKNYNYYYG